MATSVLAVPRSMARSAEILPERELVNDDSESKIPMFDPHNNVSSSIRISPRSKRTPRGDIFLQTIPEQAVLPLRAPAVFAKNPLMIGAIVAGQRVGCPLSAAPCGNRFCRVHKFGPSRRAPWGRWRKGPFRALSLWPIRRRTRRSRVRRKPQSRSRGSHSRP